MNIIDGLDNNSSIEDEEDEIFNNDTAMMAAVQVVASNVMAIVQELPGSLHRHPGEQAICIQRDYLGIAAVAVSTQSSKTDCLR